MSRRRRRGTNGPARRRRPGGRGGPSRGGSRGPTITSVGPTGNISSHNPTVHATVKDDQTELSRSDIYVYLDGEEVRGFNYQRSTGRLSFSARRLSSDTHTVEIEASAGEGNKTSSKKWTFAIN